MTPAQRAFGYAFSLLLLGLATSPAFWGPPEQRDPPGDSFPLSDYPMFSHGRPDPMMTLTHVHGVTEDGERRPLGPMTTSGNREVLQSMMTIHNAVFGGRAAPFCLEIAGRVREDGDLDDIATIELITSTFNTLDYFEDGPTPVERELHLRCRVER